MRKSLDGTVSYNLTDEGVLCDACKKKKRIEAMQKTFDKPLHRE